MRHFQNWLSITVLSVLCVSHSSSAQEQTISPDQLKALDSITPQALTGHVSFLASDLLRGRSTMSREELIAAEYIASQFRAIGLQPIGDDDFFQTVRLKYGHTNYESWRLALNVDGETIEIPIENASPGRKDAIHLSNVPVIKIVGDCPDSSFIEGIDVHGAAVITSLNSDTRDRRMVLNRMRSTVESDSMRAVVQQELDAIDRIIENENTLRGSFMSAIKNNGALLHIDVSHLDSNTRRIWRARSLWDPADDYVDAIKFGPEWRPRIRTIRLYREDAINAFNSLPEGISGCTVDLILDEPVGEPVIMRNVVGLLPGSDPELSNNYVLVTAHYDHLPVLVSQYSQEDSIWNGANDNASGTAALIEIARAFNNPAISLKRSVLFVAFCAEEKGILGSAYFTKHPIIPLDQISSVINLEMLGRTDDNFAGPQLKRISITGYDYSSVSQMLNRAGEYTGIEVYNNSRWSDRDFKSSDNIRFAEYGIPAHTLVASHTYLDFHNPGDEWDKIDYENMALLTKTAALGVWMLSNSVEVPKWDPDHPLAKPYYEAWLKLHGITP